jgi:hypothetical protein
MKKKDPWTDPDPQPGDFDEELELGHVEWVDVVFDPDLEIRLISDEEAARRLGPVKARRLGLAGEQKPAGSPKPAKR